MFLNDLIRIGGPFDGGYVVNERSILASEYLISFGVNDDWSFEAHFSNRKPDIKVLCFDHSVSNKVFLNKILDALRQVLSIRFLLLVLSFNARAARCYLGVLKHSVKIYLGFSSFFARNNIRFFSKGISSEKSQHFITMDDAFQIISREPIHENSVFIKMDIEQSEFRVLPDLLRFRDYINGMVVEFHDLDTLWPNFADLINELKTHFEITHIHGNNYGGLILNSSTPKVLEITFLKKSLIQEKRPAREDVDYPIAELDRPNDRFADDYRLVF
jgi:hypothetical protein